MLKQSLLVAAILLASVSGTIAVAGATCLDQYGTEVATDFASSTYDQTSPAGDPNDCDSLCKGVKKMCNKVAASNNECFVDTYGAYYKGLYGPYCRALPSRAQVDDCKAEIKEIMVEVKAIANADTDQATQLCEGYEFDCRAYCIANS